VVKICSTGSNLVLYQIEHAAGYILTHHAYFCILASKKISI